MSRTLLQLVQAACDEIGIPQPSAVVSGSDDQSRQLLALANREGKSFSAKTLPRGGWEKLYKEHAFVTQVLSATTGNTTSGSAVITGIPDTTGITADTFFATGTGIPYQAKIASVDSGTQVTLDRVCTETGTGVAITFAQGGYNLPSDLEYFAQRTNWDGANSWEMIGPITAQEKQILRYGIGLSGPRRRFYLRNGKMYIDPIPETDNETLAYDYYSNAWCESSGGAAQTAWTADTDIYRLDEDCFILGLKWRFLRAKGLDYSEEAAEYERECERVMARDGGGGRALPLGASGGDSFLINNDNIPDTGYGS